MRIELGVGGLVTNNLGLDLRGGELVVGGRKILSMECERGSFYN